MNKYGYKLQAEFRTDTLEMLSEKLTPEEFLDKHYVVLGKIKAPHIHSKRRKFVFFSSSLSLILVQLYNFFSSSQP